ncbi:hypothetical protein VE03_10903 [Pseudogymnoascus sp. 23342-1-I1]|nr:hypothetical protein VE03_10903 [Pseudogymnoascus sp. 23342-1-I1]
MRIQLYFAVLSGTEPKALEVWDKKEISYQDACNFILNVSKGLAEMSKSDGAVNLIHESYVLFAIFDAGAGIAEDMDKDEDEGSEEDKGGEEEEESDTSFEYEDEESNTRADIDCKSGFHGSALQGAASSGNLETVQLLLKSGADVNSKARNFGSALQAAALVRGKLEIVQLLLESGAYVNYEGSRASSSLLINCMRIVDVRALLPSKRHL